MEQEQESKLRKLVDKGYFNKSVEDFQPSVDPNLLVPGRLYFIKLRQPGEKGMDAIVMYNNTGNYPNKGICMNFTEYYSRFFRLYDSAPYNRLLPPQTDNILIIPIQSQVYIVDITDIITKASREIDRLNVAHLSHPGTEPNIINRLPYGIAPSNGPETGTGAPGIIASYLGGKIQRKKTRKSTRKKRNKKRRHNKTKK